MFDSLLSPADLAMGARLITGLPRVLRHPIRIEAARATLRRRLERREADFLDLVRWGVTRTRRIRTATCSVWPAASAGTPDEPGPILRWMTEVFGRGETPHLMSYPSSVVRLCRAATEAGLDLRRAVFTSAEEPLTAARLGTIERTWGRIVPRYSSVESGPSGYGCMARDAPDDLHLLRDLVALIQPPGTSAVRPETTQAARLPARTLLLSTLRASAPLILINVSLGDQAVLGERACGYPLEALGWTTHPRDIRSHEKLTAGGMTFLDTDLIRVLDEVLPERFGGAPTDYQPVEEEGAEGQPRLRLLVHPRVGTVDAQSLAETFLSAIVGGTESERMMALFWRESRLLHVERRPLLAAPSGKIQHLHAVTRWPRP